MLKYNAICIEKPLPITNLKNGKYKLTRNYIYMGKKKEIEVVFIEVKNKSVYMNKRGIDSKFKSVIKGGIDNVQVSEGNNIGSQIWSIKNIL